MIGEKNGNFLLGEVDPQILLNVSAQVDKLKRRRHGNRVVQFLTKYLHMVA